MPAAGADALFVADGPDVFVPTDLTRGPWSPEAQHGGAPAALLCRAVDAVAADGPMQVARITVELLRPVPLAPLRVTTEVARPGRKVQLVEASVTVAGSDAEVVRARALRIRSTDLPDAGGHVPPDETPPAPLPAERQPRHEFPGMASGWDGFHNRAMELRFVEGTFGELGPAAAWFRLTVPVVAGEEPGPLQRVAAAGDFGNGIARVLDPTRLTFINPDLTIHLLRMPVGEWVCLRSVMVTGDTGTGMAESALFDERGRIGRAVQSLLLDRR
jgi:hypothetical protein